MLINPLSKSTYLRILILGCLVIFQFYGCSSDKGDSSQVLIKEARQFLSEGKPRHALIKLKEVLQKNPKQHEARLLLGAVYLAQNIPASAEIEIRKAISLGAERKTWVDTLGRSLLMQNKNKKLLEELKLTDSDSKDIKSLITLFQGDAYIGLKKYDMAIKMFQESLQFSPDSVSPLYGLARVAMLQNQRVKALDYLDRVVAGDPGHAPAILKKGDIYFKSGRPEEALRIYEQAIAIQKSPDALLKRALALMSLSRIDEASQDLAVVLKVFPESTSANFLNARIHFLNGDTDRANDLLQEVFRVDSEYLPAHLLNGAVALSKGWDRQSENSLIKFLAANPRNLAVSKLLSVVQLRTGGSSGVIKRFADKRSAIQSDREALTLLGIAYLQSEKSDDAKKLWRAASLVRSSLLHRSDDTGPLVSDSDAQAKQPKTADKFNKEKLVYQEHYKGIVDSTIKSLLKDGAVKAENYHLAGLLMLSYGDLKKARQYIEQAIERKSGLLDAKLSLASLLIKTSEWSEAKRHLDEVLAQDKGNEQALVLLVQLYESKGNKAEALSWLKKAWKRNSKSLVLGLSVFKVYLTEKNRSKVLETQKKLIAIHDANFRMIRLLALMHGQNRDLKSAIDVLKIARKKHPTILQVRLMLAEAEAASGDFKSAEKRYKIILKEIDGHPLAMAALTNLYIRQKNLTEADDLAKSLVKRYPEKPIGYRLQGRIALLQKDAKKALGFYEKVLAIRPDSPERIAYFKLLTSEGRRAEAVFQMREWLLIKPGHHEVRLMLAGVYHEDKKNDKAASEYIYLEKNNGYRVVALNNLLWLLLEENDDKKLSTYVEKLAKLDVKSPEIQDTLGWVYLQLGQVKKAEGYLLAASKKLGDNPSVQYHLGVYYHKTGKADQSKRMLEKAVLKGDKFPEYDAAKALLGKM